jgi:hypothetical protein
MKSAAILTIKDAGDMTEEGRREIARWLRRHANWLTKYGDEYSKKFTGRYLYRGEDEIDAGSTI